MSEQTADRIASIQLRCAWCNGALAGRHTAIMPRHPGKWFHVECLPLTAEEIEQMANAPIVIEDEAS